MTFLIDTGSEVSIAKLCSLKKDININHDKSMELSGISYHSRKLHTLGTCKARVSINDSYVYHTFHILRDSDINLSQDAILGMDFLSKCNVQITINDTWNSDEWITHIPNFSEKTIENNDIFYRDFIRYTKAYAISIFIPLMNQAILWGISLLNIDNIYCLCPGCLLTNIIENPESYTQTINSELFNSWLLSKVKDLLILDSFTNIPQLIFNSLYASDCLRFDNIYFHTASLMLGSIVSTVTCSKCNHYVQKTANFIQLSLSLSNSLQTSLDTFFTENPITLNNFSCRKCNRIHTTLIKHSIIRIPKMLYLKIQDVPDHEFTDRNIPLMDIPHTIVINENDTNTSRKTFTYELLSILIFKNKYTKRIRIRFDNRESIYIHTLRTSELLVDTDDNLCQCLYVLQNLKQSNTSDTYLDSLYINTTDDKLNEMNINIKRKNSINDLTESDIIDNMYLRDASIEESPQQNSNKVSHDPNKHPKKSLRQNIPFMGTKILLTNESSSTYDSNRHIRSYDRIKPSNEVNTENLLLDEKSYTFNSNNTQNDNDFHTNKKFNCTLMQQASHNCITDNFQISKLVDLPTIQSTSKQTDTFQETFRNEFPCLQHEQKSLKPFDTRIGMSNPDNMCHANALFQAVLYDLMIEFQQRKNYTQQKQCTCIGCVLIRTTKIYSMSNVAFYPSLYHTWVSNNRPLNSPLHAQEDVHELLELIRSQLVNFHLFPGKRHRSGNTFYKPITDKFVGELVSTIHSCRVDLSFYF